MCSTMSHNTSKFEQKSCMRKLHWFYMEWPRYYVKRRPHISLYIYTEFCLYILMVFRMLLQKLHLFTSSGLVLWSCMTVVWSLDTVYFECSLLGYLFLGWNSSRINQKCMCPLLCARGEIDQNLQCHIVNCWLNWLRPVMWLYLYLCKNIPQLDEGCLCCEWIWCQTSVYFSINMWCYQILWIIRMEQKRWLFCLFCLEFNSFWNLNDTLWPIFKDTQRHTQKHTVYIPSVLKYILHTCCNKSVVPLGIEKGKVRCQISSE